MMSYSSSFPRISGDCFDKVPSSGLTGNFTNKQETYPQSLVLVDILPVECLTPQEMVEFEYLSARSPTFDDMLDAATLGTKISCVALLSSEQITQMIKGISHDSFV